jgi:hypothetical protein
MKKETWVGWCEEDEAKRKEKSFKPLLTKEHKAAIERAEHRRQLGCLKQRAEHTVKRKYRESRNTNDEARGLC